jgi:hypothetical protein
LRESSVKESEDLPSALVMAKLPNTSRTAIAITFLVMNLSTGLKRFLCGVLCLFAKTTLVSG